MEGSQVIYGFDLLLMFMLGIFAGVVLVWSHFDSIKQEDRAKIEYLERELEDA